MKLDHRKTQLLLIWSIMLLCFCVSLTLFLKVMNTAPLKQLTLSSSHHNNLKKENLIQQAKQLREQYSFMVFESERIKLEVLRIKNLKEQIKLDPYDSNLWRELTFLEASLGDKQSSDADRRWSFLVYQQLQEWNPYERTNLLKRCAYFAFESNTNADVSGACDQLFKNTLRDKSLDYIAHQLNLTASSLNQAVVFFGSKTNQEIQQ